MLDFHPSKLDSETQSRTTQIHHGDALGDLIARAAAKAYRARVVHAD